MNMLRINQLISNSIFDQSINVIDDVVFVNLDWLTNRDYQSQGINEILFSVGQYTNNIFVFLIRDGVNCRLTGLDNLIKTIIKNLNLNKDTCYIYSYENLQIENTTFIELDVVQMWCSNVNKVVNDLPLSHSSCCKKFAGLFGRHDLYRLKIARHLHDNYKQDSILSYNSTFSTWNHRFASMFVEDKTWYESVGPILLDFDKPSNWVPFQNSLQNISRHYNNYFVEIVCETDPHSNRFFTEKSLKNFYLGKPFLLFSGAGSLQYLKQRGFLTFDSWIDESYDLIQCPHRRLQVLLAEIDRLAALSIDEMQSILSQMQPLFVKNRQRFDQLASGKN